MAWQFCGHPLSARELKIIEDVAGSCAGVSRTELAATVCELLDWRRANGRLKSREFGEWIGGDDRSVFGEDLRLTFDAGLLQDLAAAGQTPR